MWRVINKNVAGHAGETFKYFLSESWKVLIQCSSETCQHHGHVPNSFETCLYQRANAFTNAITVACLLNVFAFVFIFFVLLFSILHM